MNKFVSLLAVVAVGVSIAAQDRPVNTLTAMEKAEG